MSTILFDIAKWIGGGLVWLGGLLLDTSINELVTGMNIRLLGNLGVAVDTLWVFVRDMFNILFIFGLIYIGFQTILSISKVDVKRNLALLIIAALLINFSLFFTKTVVDFSNALAYKVHESILRTLPPADTTTTHFVQTRARGPGGEPVYEPVTTNEQTIARAFMNMINLQSFEDSSTLRGYIEGEFDLAGYAIIVFILLLIMAFVFAAGAFMLLARFMMLIFYMIFSPAMFLGMIFPQMSKVSTIWWHGFLGQAFLAPAYLGMLFLSLYVLNEMNINGTIAGAFRNGSSGDPFLPFLYIFLTAAFLIGSLYVAKKLGAYGASGSMKIVQGAGRYARGSIQSFAGRTTVGLTSQGAQKLNNQLEKTSAGRWAKRGLSIASLGALDERSRQALIKQGLGAKFGGTRSRQDDIDWNKKGGGLDQHRNKLRIEDNEKKKKEENKEAREKAEKTLADKKSSENDLKDALDNLAKTLKNMSTDEKMDLGADKLKDHTIAANLTDSDIETFEKSGRFTREDIQGIKDARKDAQIKIASTGSTITHPKASRSVVTDAQRQALLNRSAGDVGKLPIDVFTQKDMYKFLTPQMIEQRMRSGITEEDRIKMKDALFDHFGRTGTLPNNSIWRKWYDQGELGRNNWSAQFFAT